MRSAIQINVWKTGMKILADYKRRKDLRQYLPHSEHWKLKNDRKSLNKYVLKNLPSIFLSSISSYDFGLCIFPS